MSKSGNLSAVSIFAIACALSGGVAIAQEGNEAADQVVNQTDASDVDDQIVMESVKVTGTLIPRSTFELPTAVTVVEADDLAKSSPSTLAAALNNLPALVADSGPTASSGTLRSAGQNFLNLRGLGNDRTLTLVNGRRFPGSTPGGQVDTNMIPQGLVERVEIVTGGASAAYGSDAVAGVINFMLDTDYEGMKVSGSVGITDEGDGLEHRISATYGKALGEKVNFIISGEYYDADGIDGDARDHRTQGRFQVSNPIGDGTVANPNNIVIERARVADGSLGGLITSSGRGASAFTQSLVGLQFNPDGTTSVFDTGTFSNGAFQNGGDGINLGLYAPISRPLERATLYAGLEFEPNENTTLFVNGGYATYESGNTLIPFHAGRDGATIRASNAFLPAEIAAGMGSRDTFRIGRYDSEFDLELQSEGQNRRLELGLEYEFGDYRLVVSGQYGDNAEKARILNNVIPSFYAQGIDSELVNGQAVCADTSNGCVAINPFGVGSYTQEMIDFFTDTSMADTDVESTIATVMLNGPLIDGIGAGSWDFAIGGSTRSEKVDVTVDEKSEQSLYATNNLKAWSGERTVDEIFAELNMPLLKDQVGAELLEVNVAARHTAYEFTDAVDTWKVGVNYSPFADLRLRGSVSRDIRAGGLGELFTRGQSGTSRTLFFDTVTDPVNPPAYQILTTQSGNPDLRPEIAESVVVGFVYSPSWAPNLDISLDRFDIQIEDAISTLSGQLLIDQCADGFTEACDKIIRDDTGTIIELLNSNFNLDRLTLKGWDFDARYVADVGPGSLRLRTLLSRMSEQVETDAISGSVVDRVGEVPTPEWRALLSVNYDVEAWNFFLQSRYRGESQLEPTFGPGDAEYNDVPSSVYVDGQIGYDFGDNMNMYLNIQNLLDKDPVFSPESTSLFYSSSNQSAFDQVGRTFRIGFRASF
jgi:iron complex outermembrane recepter protein